LSSEIARKEEQKAALAALVNKREEFYFYSLNDIDKKLFQRFFMTDQGRPAVGTRYNGRPGKFIELGAGDGVTFSNTLFFEQALGWSGILIEPVQAQYKSLRQNRPQSACFHGAVCERRGRVQIEGRGMMAHVLRPDGSSVIKDRPADHIYNDGTDPQQNAAVREVECAPLSSFMERSNVTLVQEGIMYFDLVSIDVEGSELAVLRSIDWEAVRIRVVLIELPSYNSTNDGLCRAHLIMKGYVFREQITEMDEAWELIGWSDPAAQGRPGV
jgi:FkbM family methyltransferase